MDSEYNNSLGSFVDCATIWITADTCLCSRQAMALLVPSFVCLLLFFLSFPVMEKTRQIHLNESADSELAFWIPIEFWKYASNFHSEFLGQEQRGQRNGCHPRLLHADRMMYMERYLKPMRMRREALLTFSLAVMRKVIFQTDSFFNRLFKE